MKKPRIHKLVPKKLRKSIPAEAEQPDSGPVPRITNETVAEHREEVLSSARKYIYPLQHSKHKIVLISTGLFIMALVVFFTYTTLALYKLKSSSGFLYGVTQVIPFPIAKAGSRFVSYENYLFELRHYIHYYETQQPQDFSTAQLNDYKKRALNKVVDDAYIKQLAAQHKISISDQELNDQIAIVRNQNRLGANDKGFEDVLRENFGWSVADFKRELKQQLLAQKVVATLDTNTNTQAKAAQAELNAGADFAAVAKKYSQDPSTKDAGGDYGFLLDKSNRDIPAAVTDAVFKLKPGETSSIINTGYGLEIDKNLGNQGDKIHAAHIVFVYKDINSYLNDLKSKQKTRFYISQ